MRNFIRMIMLVLMATTWSFGRQNCRMSANADAEKQVAAIYRTGIDRFNEHQLDAFLEQFDSNIDMYTPTGWLRGSAGVRERFRSTFQQFPNVRMVIGDLRTRALSHGTVIVEFSWTVYPMGKGPRFEGVGSGVYVCQRGGWKEVLEHETVTFRDKELQPQPPPVEQREP